MTWQGRETWLVWTYLDLTVALTSPLKNRRVKPYLDFSLGSNQQIPRSTKAYVDLFFEGEQRSTEAYVDLFFEGEQRSTEAYVDLFFEGEPKKNTKAYVDLFFEGEPKKIPKLT